MRVHTHHVSVHVPWIAAPFLGFFYLTAAVTVGMLRATWWMLVLLAAFARAAVVFVSDVIGDVQARDPGTLRRRAAARSVAYRATGGGSREPKLTARQSWARTVANWEAHRPTREDPR